jgi:hypothetical protein
MRFIRVFLRSITLIIAIGFLLSILLVALLLMNQLVDLSNNTVAFTNIGFAFCIGLSSISFSWSRALDIGKEPMHVRSIIKGGESSFAAALCFICASGIKYTVQEYNEPTFLREVLTRVYSGCYILATVFFLTSITFLAIVLYQRVWIETKK